MYKMIYEFLCMAYSAFLRDLLVKAIDDPSSEVDEFIVSLFDKVLNFGE